MIIAGLLRLPGYYIRRRVIATWSVEFSGLNEDNLDDDPVLVTISRPELKKASRVLVRQTSRADDSGASQVDEALPAYFALRFFRHCDLLGAEPNVAEEVAQLLFDFSVAGLDALRDPANPTPELSGVAGWSPSFRIYADGDLSDQWMQSLALCLANLTVFTRLQPGPADKSAIGFATTLVEIPVKGRGPAIDVSNRGSDAGRTIFLGLAALALAERMLYPGFPVSPSHALVATLLAATARCADVIFDEHLINDAVLAILNSETPEETGASQMRGLPELFYGSALDDALACLDRRSLTTTG